MNKDSKQNISNSGQSEHRRVFLKFNHSEKLGLFWKYYAMVVTIIKCDY